MRVKDNFSIKNYSILLSWMSWGADSYAISTNTSSQLLNINITTLHLEGQYNSTQEITVAAINCAGASDGVEFVVYEGILNSLTRHGLYNFSLPQLAALLPVHLPMAVLVSSPVPG